MIPSRSFPPKIKASALLQECASYSATGAPEKIYKDLSEKLDQLDARLLSVYKSVHSVSGEASRINLRAFIRTSADCVKLFKSIDMEDKAKVIAQKCHHLCTQLNRFQEGLVTFPPTMNSLLPPQKQSAIEQNLLKLKSVIIYPDWAKQESSRNQAFFLITELSQTEEGKRALIPILNLNFFKTIAEASVKRHDIWDILNDLQEIDHSIEYDRHIGFAILRVMQLFSVERNNIPMPSLWVWKWLLSNLSRIDLNLDKDLLATLAKNFKKFAPEITNNTELANKLSTDLLTLLNERILAPLNPSKKGDPIRPLVRCELQKNLASFIRLLSKVLPNLPKDLLQLNEKLTIESSNEIEAIEGSNEKEAIEGSNKKETIEGSNKKETIKIKYYELHNLAILSDYFRSLLSEQMNMKEKTLLENERKLVINHPLNVIKNIFHYCNRSLELNKLKQDELVSLCEFAQIHLMPTLRSEIIEQLRYDCHLYLSLGDYKPISIKTFFLISEKIDSKEIKIALINEIQLFTDALTAKRSTFGSENQKKLTTFINYLTSLLLHVNDPALASMLIDFANSFDKDSDYLELDMKLSLFRMLYKISEITVEKPALLDEKFSALFTIAETSHSVEFFKEFQAIVQPGQGSGSQAARLTLYLTTPLSADRLSAIKLKAAKLSVTDIRDSRTGKPL